MKVNQWNLTLHNSNIYLILDKFYLFLEKLKLLHSELLSLVHRTLNNLFILHLKLIKNLALSVLFVFFVKKFNKFNICIACGNNLRIFDSFTFNVYLNDPKSLIQTLFIHGHKL